MSWREVARRRSTGNVLVAGWNTAAQAHNMYSAATHLPSFFENLGGYFGSASIGKDNWRGALVMICVAASVLGGIATTWNIIQHTRGRVRLDAAIAA